MFHGALFTSDTPGLVTHIRDLDEQLAALCPEFADGRAAGWLRFCPDEFTGRGVSLADGYSPWPSTALALYSGHVVADWPMGKYVMALPSFRRDCSTWHPSVNAAVRCQTHQPHLCSALLFNHSCHDATVTMLSGRAALLPPLLRHRVPHCRAAGWRTSALGQRWGPLAAMLRTR